MSLRAPPRAFLATALLALSLQALFAQEPGDRPRVGVALSGGGARGIAHVGVLRALEDLHVPVDVIGGTSMGAIVAGLYASGLGPDEIEAVLAEVDWERILSDKPLPGALEFRRREDNRRYVWEMEMGVDSDGLQVPGGLIAGQELGELLRRHTFAAAAIDSFDHLPVPFVAIATDVRSGLAVVLRRGDLPAALRASMAIPTVFTPVEIDGRLLVDGGLTDNLPVDEVRGLGADVVVAVDVSLPIDPDDEFRSPFDVLERSAAIVSRTRVAEQLARADVVITPDLEGYGLFDFEDGGRLVELGVAAAETGGSRLRQWAVSPEDWERHRSHRTPPGPPARVAQVRFDVPGWLDPRRRDARIETRAGDPLSPRPLEEDAARLYALGEFERVGWSIERDAVVTYSADEKPWGPNYLDGGLRLVLDSGGDDFRTGIVTYDAVINLTRRRIGARGAEWRNDLRLGETAGVETEWDQPLDFAGHWFVAGGGGWLSSQQSVYEAGRLAAEYGVDRAQVRLEGGRRLGRAAELRVGLRGARIDAEVEAGSSDLPELHVGQAALTARAVVDRLDDVSFPHEGVYLRLEGLLSREGLGSHLSYDRLELEARGFASTGPHTGFAGVTMGSSLGSDLPAYDAFRLGGFLSLSGFGDGALRGSYVGVARVGYLYRFATIPPAFRGIYLAAWAEGGNVWDEGRDIGLGDLLWAGTVALGADTGIGPVFVAYGAAEDGDDRVYVALGTLF
ncbi:MAG TPA: patatin-like phospholipase family protein [Gemmatimonadota bacterium]|nr:patatin-like phospholipase family protein [Gemmatimonadota bacterium]